ncbi:MAG: hypothetical protein WCF12_08080 [Propionicimonas sp.]
MAAVVTDRAVGVPRYIRLMDADHVALIGAIGGAVGAATGVTALALQGWQFHLSGPRVRVNLANGLGVPDLDAYLMVEVANVGRLPVTGTSVGVELSNGRHIPFGNINARMHRGPDLPFRLPDGESATWLADPQAVVEGAHNAGATPRVRAFAMLATGKRLRSQQTMNSVEAAMLNQR